MGLYGGVQDAKYSEGGAYIDQGVFLLEIQALKTIKKRDGKGAFVAEFKAIETGGGSNWKPGSFFSWMTSENDNFLGNVKNFAAVASACYQGIDDVDDTTITEEVLLALTAETGDNPNPFKGVKIRCSAVTIPTKKKDGKFTKCRWMPFVTDAVAMAAAHEANR